MVGTRKTPSGRTTVTLDGSPGLEVAGDEFEEDTTDIVDWFSVSFSLDQLFLHINFLGTPQFCTTLLGWQCHQPMPIQFCQSTYATFGPQFLVIARVS